MTQPAAMPERPIPADDCGYDGFADPRDANAWELYAPGRHLTRLRAGEKLDLSAKNPYLLDAVAMNDMLFTLPEVENTGLGGIFPGPPRPVILEIGCYMGETVKEVAEQNGDFNVLGVDIRYKRVVKSVNRIRRARLSNAKIAVADARELITALPDASLYGIITLFPDPWRKLKHEKHRFLNDHFFANASRKIYSGGFVWIKTDSREYLREAIRYATHHGFTEASELPRRLVRETHTTFFETLFSRRLGMPVHQLILSRG